MQKLLRKMNYRITKLFTKQYFKLIKTEQKTFIYKGKSVKFCTNPSMSCEIEYKMTERAVELAIAREWLKGHAENVIEIGAVTPYYFPRAITEIVDPTDKHKLVTIHKSVFDMDLTGRNVLSISTVEHIGTGDYGLVEAVSSIEAVKKIIKESRHCVITYPIGYNKQLDCWTKHHFENKHITAYASGRFNNNWVIREDIDVLKTRYKYADFCGNAIIVIEK